MMRFAKLSCPAVSVNLDIGTILLTSCPACAAIQTMRHRQHINNKNQYNKNNFSEFQ